MLLSKIFSTETQHKKFELSIVFLLSNRGFLKKVLLSFHLFRLIIRWYSTHHGSAVLIFFLNIFFLRAKIWLAGIVFLNCNCEIPISFVIPYTLEHVRTGRRRFYTPVAVAVVPIKKYQTNAKTAIIIVIIVSPYKRVY